MVLLYIFGLLAFAACLLTLAAKTCTLWKSGMTFFLNWVLCTLINFSLDVLPYKAALYSVIDFLSMIVCAEVFFRYKCKTNFIMACAFIVMTSIHFSIVFFDIKGWMHPLLNAMFITQASILIFVSSKRMLSKSRRSINIGPRGPERRRTFQTQTHKKIEEVDYA